MTVLAIDKYATNADLIVACAELGYLRDEWRTLDPTYGEGTFWNKWRPRYLTRTDLNADKSPDWVGGRTFTKMGWPSRYFDAVVFDPPYKLNGTPDATIDERYGVDTPMRWQDRMELCKAGILECARVLGAGYLLVKCQDQVCSGKMRWQTIEFADVAASCGLGLVDRLDFLSYRAQPANVRQIHARRVSSQLLVFKRGW